ncbi:CHAT domain-containing protein [Anabaena sp. PCC 7938]|uniref:Tetratricopeptide TPR_1 repeat-containing protein n=2 Tax=Anabaena cylindrica TaxID=1165 RepID=K9ZQ74_ANACC|nr:MULTISPECIES: CHAT domain-containing tetratricopeptide repeat protein [Anabaena]AFZ60682.1 Tetratricopeptide TPR_1 repeat-containing protein [Anabaena cylindrica PCC 7122]MBY5282766.1 CHAT domain-containing protein [Anabaena sp. CCAP 1446/1C]BAY02233.1 TPR repeat-containing protein [Anabaena cylindrica PCC 7122]
MNMLMLKRFFTLLTLVITCNTFYSAKVLAQNSDQIIIPIPEDATITDPFGRNYKVPNPSQIYPINDFTPQQAIKIFEESLAVARRERDAHAESLALMNLANVYTMLGDFGNYQAYLEAVKFFEQSLKIRHQLQEKDGETITWLNLGNVYHRLGNYELAITAYEKSLALARQVNDYWLMSGSLRGLSFVYSKQNNFPKSLDYLQQAWKVAKLMNSPQQNFSFLHDLGYAFFRANRLKDAKDTLYQGIENWESLISQATNTDAEKITIGEVQQSLIYRTLQRVLVAENRYEQALEISERVRTKAFLELLNQRFPGYSTAQSSSLPNIELLKKIAQEQQATIVEYSIIEDQKIDKGIGKLELGEIFIWVIQPNGQVKFRRSDFKAGLANYNRTNAPLQELIVEMRQSLRIDSGRGIPNRATPQIGEIVRLEGRPIEFKYKVERIDQQKGTIFLRPVNADNNDRPAKEYLLTEIITDKSIYPSLKKLHELLIEPIAEFLPTNPDAKVIFIPERVLFLVPFAALQDNQGNYLIDKHTILTAPSIQVLNFTNQQRRKVQKAGLKQAVVVGDPTMPFLDSIGRLPSLPNAKIEAEAIANLLPYQTKLLIGKEATKQKVVELMPKARIIHLATHALLSDLTGGKIPGAIALTPSPRDNGFLTAEEILNLRLNAELVILSACDTGRGRLTIDGVVGLSRSLIATGVPSVIVSFWSVPDAPTALLMKEFYQEFLHRNPDKAKALRIAMLKTKTHHPDPKDWAAFILIGEAK